MLQKWFVGDVTDDQLAMLKFSMTKQLMKCQCPFFGTRRTARVKAHKLIHIDDTKISTCDKWYVFNECSKTFNKPFDLGMHKLCRSSKELFACKKCDKTFKRNREYQDHLQQ